MSLYFYGKDEHKMDCLRGRSLMRRGDWDGNGLHVCIDSGHQPTNIQQHASGYLDDQSNRLVYFGGGDVVHKSPGDMQRRFKYVTRC